MKSWSAIFPILFIAMSLSGCGDDVPPNDGVTPKSEVTITMPSDAKAEDKDYFTKFYPKLEKACPGLKQYAGGLTFAGIEHNYNTDFVFKVAGDDRTLPNEWMADGHTCHFGVTKDKANLSVSKLPCKSLCLGESVKEGSDVDHAENYIVPLEQTDAEKAETAQILADDATNADEEIAKLERKARKKDYQAQRNLAYMLSGGQLVGHREATDAQKVSACAWRFVILKSGSDKVNASDEMNFSSDCAKLSDPQKDKAANDAAKILTEVYGK